MYGTLTGWRCIEHLGYLRSSLNGTLNTQMQQVLADLNSANLPNQRYLRASLIGTRTVWRLSGNTLMQQIHTDLVCNYLNRDVL